MDARRIGSRLYIDGFIYRKTSTRISTLEQTTYWSCIRWKNRELHLSCSATAITSSTCTISGENIEVRTGPFASPHNHTPNLEDIVKAQATIGSIIQGVPWKRRICNNNRGTDMSNNARQVGTKMVHVTGMKSTRNFAMDVDTYRRFLEKLVEKSIRNRDQVLMDHSIMEALRSTYKTERERMHAYAFIIENLKKVTQDFEALKRKPDVGLHNLKEYRSVTGVQGNIEIGPRVIHNEKILGNVSSHLEKLEELTRRVFPLKATRPPVQRVEGSKGAVKEIVKEAAKIQPANNIPPVPAAIPIHEFLESASSYFPVINLPNGEVEVKKEVEVIDITDEVDVRQECRNQYVAGSEPNMQAVARAESVISQGDIISSDYITSSDMATTKSVDPQIHQDLLQGQPNPNVFGLLGHLPEVSSGQFHPEVQSNMQGMEPAPSYFNRPLDQSYDSIRPNLNEPVLISNLQIPLVHDVSSVNYGGDVNAGQYYTEIRVYRRPAVEYNTQPGMFNGSKC